MNILKKYRYPLAHNALSTEKTIVVFRKYPEGDILALFPHEQSSRYFCTCYQHVGQHGEADYTGCIAATKAATPAEYTDLKKELERIGYNLEVRKRASCRFTS